jgi:hypothetical protein
MFHHRARILISALGLYAFGVCFCACGAQPEKPLVVVCFDVEDYITPAGEGIDDIPKWLADTMGEVGVPGTFFIIAEKARSLERRGRTDVIAAMARHDVGSHTNLGSIHPTVAESLEKADWASGVKQMRIQEEKGLRDLERLTGKAVTTLGQHGGSYGPQLVAALADLHAGFVYSPIHLPGHNAVWFANTLNFHGSYGGFDDTYYRDDLFDARFRRLQESFPQDIAGVDVLAFFAAHPCKIRTVQFWDFNYYDGANPEPEDWKTPELRPKESMPTARKNFRRLMEFLKGRDDIELTTFSELMQKFSYQPPHITARDLQRLAQRVLDRERILIDDDYSPAELFEALAESLAVYKETGKLPRRLDRFSPLGPMQMPPVEPECSKITRDQVLELAQEADIFIHEHHCLPTGLELTGCRIGAGSLLSLFSAAYGALSSGRKPEEFQVKAFEAYPHADSEAILQSVRECKGWPVHRRDLDMSRLVEFTKMQLWTLKPARRK